MLRKSITSNTTEDGLSYRNIYRKRATAMSTYKATRDLTRMPTHPGEILKEDILPALNMPVATAARYLGISRQTLHRILAGTLPVTPPMALRLGKFCGYVLAEYAGHS
jgi:addiction module HigA family antidote